MKKALFYASDMIIFLSLLFYIKQYYDLANIIILLNVELYMYFEGYPKNQSYSGKIIWVTIFVTTIITIVMVAIKCAFVNNDFINYEMIYKAGWLIIIVSQLSTISKAKKEYVSMIYSDILIMLMIFQYVFMTFFYYVVQ